MAVANAGAIISAHCAPFNPQSSWGSQLPRIPDGNQATNIRYVRMNLNPNTDVNGNLEIQSFGNPYMGFVPVLTSNMSNGSGAEVLNPPSINPNQSNVINNGFGIANQTNLATNFNNAFPTLMNQLYINTPRWSRCVGHGIRVWSLQGTSQPQGLMRAAPMDPYELLRYYGFSRSDTCAVGRQEPSQVLTGTAPGSLVNTFYAAPSGTIPQYQSGAFSAANFSAPNQNPGFFSGQRTPAQQFTYMSSSGQLAELPNEFKLFHGQKGASVRSTLMFDKISMQEFKPQNVIWQDYMNFPISTSGSAGNLIQCDGSWDTWAYNSGSGTNGYEFAYAANSTAANIASDLQSTYTFKVNTLADLLNTGNPLPVRREESELTACRISCSQFPPNSPLYLEVVWILEEVPTLAQVQLGQEAKGMPDLRPFWATLKSRDAYPVVVSGHSFFSKIEHGLARFAQKVGHIAREIVDMTPLGQAVEQGISLIHPEGHAIKKPKPDDDRSSEHGDAFAIGSGNYISEKVNMAPPEPDDFDWD